MAPPIPGRPGLSEAISTSEFIGIIWDPPSFDFSDMFYTICVNTTTILKEMNQFSGTVSALLN